MEIETVPTSDALEPPDGVSKDIWDQLSAHGREDCYDCSFPIAGVSPELWENLRLETKRELKSLITPLRPRSNYSSKVAKFFCDFSSSDIDYNSAINALALISALLLTIPFQVFTVYSGEHMKVLYALMDECKDYPYDQLRIKQYILGNLALTCYGSMASLVLCTFYYVFVGSKSNIFLLTRHQAMKERAFILAVFIATFCAVVGAMNSFENLIEWYFAASNATIFCPVTTSDAYFIPGTFVLIFCVPLSFYLLW